MWEGRPVLNKSMPHNVGVQEFLQIPGVILDVRSPLEFTLGRIPGASNFPLFSDAERAEVGTLYKKEGPANAIRRGLQLVMPKLPSFTERAREFSTKGVLKIHCWRGGMRSSSVADYISSWGMQTVQLSGGYKAFRRWVHQVLSQPKKLIVLSGLTGSGKTSILGQLRSLGEQVIDLEELAHHRGSSFGSLGAQPSTEHFQNELAFQWAKIDPSKRLWIEDENSMIGTCYVSAEVYSQMRSAPLVIIQRPIEERHQRILEDYGNLDPSNLIKSTTKIAKRLGGVRTKEVVSLISQNKLLEAIKIVLEYYDAAYQHSRMKKDQPIFCLEEERFSDNDWARHLINTMENK